jgi:hypothetical protein
MGHGRTFIVIDEYNLTYEVPGHVIVIEISLAIHDKACAKDSTTLETRVNSIYT